MTRRPVLAGTVLVTLGLVLLLGELDVIDVAALVASDLLWPVLLVGFGGWLLVRRPGRRPGPAVIATNGDRIDVVTVLSDRTVQVAPGTFAGGSIVTVLGDVDLDLTAAEPADRVQLEGTTVLGDVDLLVPSHWEVTASGSTILGDVRIDPRTPSREGELAPELVLALVTVLGDLRVRRAPVPARRPETAEH